MSPCTNRRWRLSPLNPAVKSNGSDFLPKMIGSPCRSLPPITMASTGVFDLVALLAFRFPPHIKYIHRERDYEMGIVYCMVGRGHVVLAEFSGTSTNASAISRQMLEKMAEGDTHNHASFSQDRYLFHVKRTDGLTLLCMADDALGRRIPFAFLEDIQQRFVKTYGRAIHSAPAYAMNDEFSRVLSQQMDHYSNDPNADRLNRLKDEMNKVRNVMIENIDKVLDRGDRLELLVDKTATFQGNTIRFRKQARRFKSTQWWRNVKLIVAMVLILLLIIYPVLAFFCRGLLLPSCLK